MSESKTVYEWGTERGLTPQAEIVRLRRENERLREALKDIAISDTGDNAEGWHCSECQYKNQTPRQALGEEAEA